MGTIQHTALIVTSFDTKGLKAAHKKAMGIFGEDAVTESAGDGQNGYKSFMVAPCGSKLGWEQSDEFLAGVEAFITYLNRNGLLSYVKVDYGELGNYIEGSERDLT